MPIRVLIADDHGILRAGLRSLLDSASETEVVGEARDGEEALRLAKELRPDVLLVDISMPDASGIEVARQLRGTLPETRVLILTVHEDQSDTIFLVIPPVDINIMDLGAFVLKEWHDVKPDETRDIELCCSEWGLISRYLFL